MADHLELVVYDDTDEAELFAVGTDPSHERPYLKMPSELGASEVDLLNGKAMISLSNLEIIDPQTGATKQDRWLSEQIATADGFSAINRRRAKLWYPDTGEVIEDGVVGGSSLNDSFSAFTLPLRDIRERGRKIAAFTRGDTATVLPRGVLNGYGALPNGKWLIPPTTPLSGQFVQVGAAPGITGYVRMDGPDFADSKKQVDARLVLTEKMKAAMQSATQTGRNGSPICDLVSVLWRPEGGGDWTEVSGLESLSSGDFIIGILQPTTAKVGNNSVTVVRAVWMDDKSNTANVLPTDGQRVEIIVRYVGPVSEDYPLHIESTWGEVAVTLLDGDYSTNADGSAVDPRIRYDEAAFLAIDRPVRARITKPIEDIRNALEQMCKQIGAAPTLNAAGEISPTLYDLPDASVTLPQIDDSNAVAIAGWSHEADSAITSVHVTYRRDFSLLAPGADLLGENSAGDGIASREVNIVRAAPPEVIAVMGDEDKLEIDAWLFRSLGGEFGQPVSGDVTQESGWQLAEEATYRAGDRFYYGGQSGFVRINTADLPTVRAGSWVIDARSWRPDYGTRKRGGNALAQVVSFRRVSPGWAECRLIDAGPSASPLAAPTVSVPVLDDADRVVVEILTAPAGAEVEVRYVISDTEPLSNSGTWMLLGRGVVGDVFTSPALPAGGTAWVQARSVAIARRPSAWVSAGDVTAAQTPRVLTGTLTVLDDGSALLTWTVNPFVLGVRIHYGTSSTLTDSVDVDASDGEYTFPAGTVPAGLTLSVELEPYTGWTGTAVSGTAGEVFPLSDASTATEQSTEILRWGPSYTDETGDTVPYEGEVGAAVTFVLLYELLREIGDPSPWADDAIETLGEISEIPIGADRTIAHAFDVPPDGFVRYFRLRPVSVLSDSTVAGNAIDGVVYSKNAGTPAVDRDDFEDDTFGYAWIYVQPGTPVLSVDVVTQIADLPPYPSRAPAWSEGDTSTVKGRTLLAGEYEDAVALGSSSRRSRITFFLNLANGDRVALPSFYFDPDKNPNFQVEPYFEAGTTRLRYDGDNFDSVSSAVFKVGGLWHVLIDFGGGLVDVSEADADANPGHGTDERASYDVFLYSAPIDTITLGADGVPTDGTLYDVRRLQLETGTPSAEPVITKLELTPPSIGSDLLGILLACDSAPLGYTAGLEYQYQVGADRWSAWEDITADLSPALTTPPTSDTAYTFATGWIARAKVDSAPLTLSVNVRGYIKDGSSVRVAETASVPRNWVIDPPEEA